jgi:hypothetical protein
MMAEKAPWCREPGNFFVIKTCFGQERFQHPYERISHHLEEKGVDSIEGSLMRELDS